MTTGERIKMLRSNAGYSRVAFAQKINIPQTTLRNYENNDREPGHTFLILLAKEFNVSVDYILGVEADPSRLSAPASDNLTKEQREYVEKYFELNLEGRERVHATINFEYAKQQGERKTVTKITQTSNILNFQPPESVGVKRYFLSVCAGTGNYLDENVEYEEVKIIKNICTYGADYIVPLQGDSMEPEFHDGDNLIISDARGKECFEGRVGIFIVDGDAFLRRPLTIEGGVKVLRAYNPKYKDIVLNEYTDARYIGYVVCILDDSWVVG